MLIICTAVPHVSTKFGTPDEEPLGRVSMRELERHYDGGEFPPGSMGPKVKACLDFVRGGGVGSGRRAIITDMEHLQDALEGKSGTVVSRR